MAATAGLGERPGEEDAAMSAEAQPARGILGRLAPARLTSRIILLNVGGLIILVSGILYFNQFRQGLIDARVQSLLTQGQIISAAIASAASADTGSIVIDPDKLMETQPLAGQDNEDAEAMNFPIDPERAGPVLRQLVSPAGIRGRIYDRDGLLIVDSRYLYGRADVVQNPLPEEESVAGRTLSLWRKLNSWLFRNNYPRQKEYGLENGREFPEVTAALNGASVSVVRVNDRNEIVISVAVPVQRLRAVLGTLVLSTQGGEIDGVIQAERKVVLFTFSFAALVTVLLSVLLAGTIAEPIRRLAASAELVRRGVNKRVEIPDFSARRDEVGHLSSALRDMTNALYARIDAIEAFAADVSHELKNPLTSLRSAVETFAFARNDEQRARLIEIIKDDVKRLDRLITDISDASRLDAELARNEARPVNLRQLLETLVSLANETGPAGSPRIEMEVAPLPRQIPEARGWLAIGHDARLGQVVRNLLDNARSFTAAGSTVRVRLRRGANDIEFRVEDEGPGIRPENLERIFERFYTDRPEMAFGKNSGLGLAISRQIVEAHRGRIWAENRLGPPVPGAERSVQGARFIVRIPAATGEKAQADA